MTVKGEPEFTIDGTDDDVSTGMSAMPVTDPGLAPTMDDIQQVNDPNAATSTVGSPPISPNSTTNMLSPASAASSAFDQPVDRSMFGPSGRWSAGFFSCFDTFFTALFWMGFCCTPILYGQLMQRMNLDAWGRSPAPGEPRVSGICMRVLIFVLVTYSLLLLIDNAFLWDVLSWIVIAYCLFMGILLRHVIRRRFGIGAMWLQAFDGNLEDALLACCCGCCSGIQMARHTHDESRYPYHGCGTNGLASYAPDLWDGSLLEDQPMDPAYHSNPPTRTGSQEMTAYPAAAANASATMNTTTNTQSPNLMTNVEIV